MEVDIHHAEEIKVRVRDFPAHTAPFCILDMKTNTGGDVSLFFNSTIDIVRFAWEIIHKACEEQKRVAEESP